MQSNMKPKKKILNRKNLSSVIKSLKKKNKKIVFTNGCFDLLHLGHIDYLNKAKSKGDILIVGLNSDSSVRKIKGNLRPINSQKSRIAVLSALECIDYIAPFNETTPLNLIRQVVPDVLIKGADWKAKDIIGAQVVLKNKGKIARIPYVKGFSTSSIIKKIKATK